MARKAALSIGGQVHDPTDPIGKLLFAMLAMIAEFERDLISQRTREGMALARTKGRLKGRSPKLSPARERHLVKLFDAGDHTVTELVELFQVSKPTVYRAVQRARTRSEGENP